MGTNGYNLGLAIEVVGCNRNHAAERNISGKGKTGFGNFDAVAHVKGFEGKAKAETGADVQGNIVLCNEDILILKFKTAVVAGRKTEEGRETDGRSFLENNLVERNSRRSEHKTQRAVEVCLLECLDEGGEVCN